VPNIGRRERAVRDANYRNWRFLMPRLKQRALAEGQIPIGRHAVCATTILPALLGFFDGRWARRHKREDDFKLVTVDYACVVRSLQWGNVGIVEVVQEGARSRFLNLLGAWNRQIR
jgi:hypothetical protein